MDFFDGDYYDYGAEHSQDEDDIEEELWEDLGLDFVHAEYRGTCDACDHNKTTWLLSNGIAGVCTCVFCLRKLGLCAETSTAAMRIKIEQYVVELKKRKEEKNNNNNNIRNIEIVNGVVVPFTPAPPPNKPNPPTNDILPKASGGTIVASLNASHQPSNKPSPPPITPKPSSIPSLKISKPTPNNDGVLNNKSINKLDANMRVAFINNKYTPPNTIKPPPGPPSMPQHPPSNEPTPNKDEILNINKPPYATSDPPYQPSNKTLFKGSGGAINISESSQIQPPYQPSNKTLFKGSGGNIIVSESSLIQPPHKSINDITSQASGGNIAASLKASHQPSNMPNPPPIKVPYLYLEIPKPDYKFSWQREAEEASITMEYDDVESSAPAPPSQAKGGDTIILNTPQKSPTDITPFRAKCGDNIILNIPQNPPTDITSVQAKGDDNIGLNTPATPSKPPLYDDAILFGAVAMLFTLCSIYYTCGDGLLSRGGLGLPGSDGLLSGGLGLPDGRLQQLINVSIDEVLCGSNGDLFELSGGGVPDVINGDELGRLSEKLSMECEILRGLGDGLSQSIGGLLKRGTGDGLNNELAYHEMVFYNDTIYDAVPTDRDKNEVIILLDGVLKDRDKDEILLRYEDMILVDILRERDKYKCYKYCMNLYERDKEIGLADAVDTVSLKQLNLANAESLASIYVLCGTESHNNYTVEAVLATNGDPLVYIYHYFIGYSIAVVKKLFCEQHAEQVASLDAIAAITKADGWYQITNNDMLYIGYGYDGHGLNCRREKNILMDIQWVRNRK